MTTEAEHIDWLAELRTLVSRLRGPDGCPWDREQTHESLLSYLIEEAYEFVDAVEEGCDAHMMEELGDLLLQVALHGQIAGESGRFDMQDAARACCEKLRRRHPHVFAAAAAEDSAAVVRQWEAIKRAETGRRRADIGAGVPKCLPALSRAEKLQRRAARAGMAGMSPASVCADVAAQLRAATSADGDAAAHLGEALFAVVALCRAHGVDPERALRARCAAFEGVARAAIATSDAEGHAAC